MVADPSRLLVMQTLVGTQLGDCTLDTTPNLPAHREDHRVLRKISKVIEPRMFQWIVRLPFIVITRDQVLDLDERIFQKIDPKGGMEDARNRIIKKISQMDAEALENLLPFHQFAFWNAAGRSDDACLSWYRLEFGQVAHDAPAFSVPMSICWPNTNTPSESMSRRFKKHIENTINVLTIKKCSPNGLIRTYDGESEIQNEIEYDLGVSHRDIKVQKKLNGAAEELFNRRAEHNGKMMSGANAVINDAFSDYVEMLLIFVALEELDLRRVVQTPRDKKPMPARGAVPISDVNRVALPRTLYLATLPSEHHESTGEGAPKRGHERRGHWRKLTHPRFRHHPKYGQKIRVRPCWVGPYEVDYQGARYVVPLEERDQS